MGFELDKKNILGRPDKSKIGEIDKNIRQICSLINSREEYYTASSCSGRIVLLEAETAKKDEAKWLFVSHSETDFDSVNEKLNSSSDVWLRQEGAILHICCRDLKSAEKLVNLFRNAGFKRAGIISANNRFVVEIISSEHLCAPVIKKGRRIADEEYLKILVSEANQKIRQNREKLEKLKTELRKL